MHSMMSTTYRTISKGAYGEGKVSDLVFSPCGNIFDESQSRLGFEESKTTSITTGKEVRRQRAVFQVLELSRHREIESHPLSSFGESRRIAGNGRTDGYRR